ncbi:hypothetical protein K1719_027966 [Acacia pycnantha]|nr:hypothetical protein K1719_027966 [Acacia pycnantha]
MDSAMEGVSSASISSFSHRIQCGSKSQICPPPLLPNFSYSGLDVSKAFVSVTAGNFTLMRNLSTVSLTADYLNKAYLMEEFIIHVSGRTLELTFSPSSNASDVYAFVNGIEVVSMPSNLYIQGDNAHIPLVGHDPVRYYIHNDSALETMYRINTGGSFASVVYEIEKNPKILDFETVHAMLDSINDIFRSKIGCRNL